MNKLILASVIALALVACNRTEPGIFGNWEGADGENKTKLTLDEKGWFRLEKEVMAAKKNMEVDSGTWIRIEGDIYEFTPLTVRRNGSAVNITTPVQVRLTPDRDGNLTMLQGMLFLRDTAIDNRLEGSTWHNMTVQGEYNNAFTKYVFTKDSLFRYMGYSQTPELADSLYRPYTYTGLRVADGTFITVRTAPDGKEYTEDFSYYFIGKKLFFGRSEDKVSLKK